MVIYPKIQTIPVEFIQANLSNYQKDIIELKYYLFKRFTELRKKGKPKIDIYLLLEEEVPLKYDSIAKIIIAIQKKYHPEEIKA